MESFNSDVITVVNGQRITAFVNDCLCGFKALTQYVFKFCSYAALIPDIDFFLYLMKFGFLLFEENYQLNRLCMLNDSYISSA